MSCRMKATLNVLLWSQSLKLCIPLTPTGSAHFKNPDHAFFCMLLQSPASCHARGVRKCTLPSAPRLRPSTQQRPSGCPAHTVEICDPRPCLIPQLRLQPQSPQDSAYSVTAARAIVNHGFSNHANGFQSMPHGSALLNLIVRTSTSGERAMHGCLIGRAPCCRGMTKPSSYSLRKLSRS